MNPLAHSFLAVSICPCVSSRRIDFFKYFFTAFSDETLKTDVNTINDALGTVGKLRGVSYKWKENNEASIGVIAQEVEQVIPEVVHTSEHNGKEVKSVDYGKMVGVLINAINELKAEVEELKNAKITG